MCVCVLLGAGTITFKAESDAQKDEAPPAGADIARKPSLSGTSKDPLFANKKISIAMAPPPPSLHYDGLLS